MKKLIDLTHVIDPSAVQRKFSVETIGADEVNHNVVRLEGQWYIMSNISMVSHIGTHIEVPYHIFRDGHDLSTMPIDAFCGEAVVLDLSGLPARSAITARAVEEAAAAAGGIRPGDAVLCSLGMADFYGTEKYAEAPYFSTEAINALIASGMKLMGVDATGVEIPQSEQHVNHTALFAAGVPLIENVAHLGLLTDRRYRLYAFPVPIKGVESFPVRVVAEAL